MLAMLNKSMKVFRSWLAKEMAQYPHPGQGWWRMQSKFPDDNGKKPWIWYKKGSSALPVYTPEDPRRYDPKDLYSTQEPSVPYGTKPAASTAKPVAPAAPPIYDDAFAKEIYAQAAAMKKAKAQPAQGQPSEWWICGHMLNTGEKVALHKDEKGNWEFRRLSKIGKVVKGSMPAAALSKVVKSVDDPTSSNGKKMVRDPMEWLQGTDVANSNSPVELDTETEPTPAAPIQPEAAITGPYPPTASLPPEVAKKRLPPSKLNEYGRKIEAAFLGDPNVPHSQQPNMVMNALAGTGKTTMLKHLATFMRPGERWIYLVYNNRNGAEARHASKGFPYTGAEGQLTVLTSHAFLGEVLKENDQVVPKTNIPDKQQFKGDVISYILQDPKKIWYEQMCKKLGVKHTYLVKKPIKKLASWAKNYALDPTNPQIGEQLNALVDKYQLNTTIKSKSKYYGPQEIDYKPQIVAICAELLRRSMPGQTKDPGVVGLRDHDDTLWYFALHGNEMRLPPYDVALVDEVQDFNICQQMMLRRLHDPRSKGGSGARIICVGDPNQAIYRFRGADSQSFQDIMREFGAGGHVYDLPVNWRSAEQIVQYVNANTHVTNLQPGRKAPDGKGLLQGVVTTNKKYDDSMQGIISEFATIGKAAKQTAFICRQNKPLVQTALQLIKNHIGFTILGRDVAQNLIWKLRDCIDKQYPNPDIYQLESNVDTKLQAVVYELANEPDMRKVQALEEEQEWLECLQSIFGHLERNEQPPDGSFGIRRTFVNPKTNQPIQNANDFVSYLEGIFGKTAINTDQSDEDSGIAVKRSTQAKGQWDAYYLGKHVGTAPSQTEAEALLEQYQRESIVTLSTAHRSKGFEFDRVFIINNGLFEKKTKGKDQKPIPPEELEQEQNAKYVAYTRAEQELHVLNDDAP